MVEKWAKEQLAGYLAAKESEKRQEAAKRKTPAIRQHEYEMARKSVLGEFSCETPHARQACVSDKAARRKERLDLTTQAFHACPGQRQMAARLREDMDEVENMRCAKHVYLANDPKAPPELKAPPPGFKMATENELKKMDLNKRMLSPEDSQFRAAVYVKDPEVWGENPQPPMVLAFRGSTPAEEDWQNNFAQNFDLESPYYENAVKIGNALAMNKAKVHLVGHSLGGGLASAAQGGSGLTASTYNAAGLHPNTVKRYSTLRDRVAAEPDKITAIRFKDDVLTRIQERGPTSWFAHEAVGSKKDLAPPLSEEEFEKLKQAGKADAEEDYAGHLHGMDQLIAAMEKRKAEDEQALRRCLGKA